MAFLSLSRRGLLSLALVALASLPAAAQRETGTIATAQGTSTTCVTRGVGQSCVRTNVPGNVGSLTVQVTGSGTYTLQFEVSSDGGATWYQPGGVNLSSYARESSTTGAGRWGFGNSGITHLQVRASAYTSGTPAVVITGGAGGITAPLSAGSISGGNDAAGTIGAAVPGSGSYTAVNIGGNLTGWTGLTVGSVNAGAMALVDASGNQITSFGGGTQYAVDAALGATPTGTLAVAIRDDALSALTPVEGDAIGLRVDANGALWVIPSGTTTVSGTVTANLAAGTNNIGDVDVASIAAGDNNIGNVDIVSMPADATELPAAAALADNTANPTVPGVGAYLMGFETTWDRLTSTSGSLNVNITGGAGSGGTAIADDGDFTAGTTSFTPVGGFYQSTVTACTDGDTCAAGITTGRAVKVALANADGSLVTYQTDATEDAAESNGVTGPVSLTVRRDTAASSAGTTGDYATANTDALGRLWARDGNPCADHARISTAAISTSASGNVEIVALNGSDLIYVCGYSIVAGAATGVRFVYGTGSACATGETGLTGVWSFAANGGITQANGGAPQFVVPAGNAFCTENSGANAIAGHVTYVRTAAP